MGFWGARARMKMDGPSKSTIYGGQTWVDDAVEQSIWLLFLAVVSRNVTKGETGLAVEEMVVIAGLPVVYILIISSTLIIWSPNFFVAQQA